MTPTDGRDVAEAAVDLEGARARVRQVEQGSAVPFVYCAYPHPDATYQGDLRAIARAATPPPSQPAEGEREAIAKALFERFKRRAQATVVVHAGSYASDDWERLPASFARSFYEDADTILALRSPAQPRGQGQSGVAELRQLCSRVKLNLLNSPGCADPIRAACDLINDLRSTIEEADAAAAAAADAAQPQIACVQPGGVVDGDAQILRDAIAAWDEVYPLLPQPVDGEVTRAEDLEFGPINNLRSLANRLAALTQGSSHD